MLIAADGSARLRRPALITLADGFLSGLSAARGVRWTDEPARLIGRVRGDPFENDPEALVAG
ncbi:MAG: hypothetical protein AB7O78_16505 [Thermoleophilia bacterium]